MKRSQLFAHTGVDAGSRLGRRAALVALGALPAMAVARYAGQGLHEPLRDSSPREVFRRRSLPDVTLKTHHGKTVRFYEDLVKDRTVVINFMYISCADGTCPVTTYNLKMVQDLLKDRVGRDVFMYSISLDPARDSVEMLRNYAEVHGTGPGWLFLRAERRELDTLRRSLGFYDRDPALDAQMSNHAATLRIGHEPSMSWTKVSGLRNPQGIARVVLQTLPTALTIGSNVMAR